MSDEFATHGIESDRISLVGRIPDIEEHLKFYSQIDIALDTFPYNGTTTTFEALWMGVPVISIEGNSHRARVGSSILRNLGLQELLCSDEAAFLEKVKSLSQDRDRLHELQDSLRDRLTGSPVCDGARFAAKMESAGGSSMLCCSNS